MTQYCIRSLKPSANWVKWKTEIQEEMYRWPRALREDTSRVQHPPHACIHELTVSVCVTVWVTLCMNEVRDVRCLHTVCRAAMQVLQIPTHDSLINHTNISVTLCLYQSPNSHCAQYMYYKRMYKYVMRVRTCIYTTLHHILECHKKFT